MRVSVCACSEGILRVAERRERGGTGHWVWRRCVLVLEHDLLEAALLLVVEIRLAAVKGLLRQVVAILTQQPPS